VILSNELDLRSLAAELASRARRHPTLPSPTWFHCIYPAVIGPVPLHPFFFTRRNPFCEEFTPYIYRLLMDLKTRRTFFHPILTAEFNKT
jgi:hypothetical protein